jgi:FlaA1/EpsC-like NDP-sugar epimerase
MFTTILLAVIVITNIPLRGMWSFMVILVVVALSIIFALAGWWDAILRYFHYLDIRINAGGYIFISLFLFAIWLFTVLVFDKQIYMVFTPGQFKVCTEVGGGEQTYSTIGMTLEKQRSDLFRHWILGLGSGDLIVKTTGAQAHHFEMSNVLFVGRKMQQIEDMVRKIPD